MVLTDDRREFSSKAFRIGSYWPGYSNRLRHLVLFGASYCDVGYNHKSPRPTTEQPLGVEFPGCTYAEPGEPNWVGHIITKYPPPKSSESTTNTSSSDSACAGSILVFDYAVGGARVDGVKYQVENRFFAQGSAGWKPEWAPWTSGDTLFVTWVGINDCGYDVFSASRISNYELAMKTLFETQHMLYDAGARNLLFINVPPVGRFGGKNKSCKNHKTWNKHLEEGVATFTESHPDVTTMIFSAWELFHDVMDHPEKYGFTKEDVEAEAGGFLVDGLHPTSKMHEVIAREVAAFLRSVSASQETKPNHEDDAGVE